MENCPLLSGIKSNYIIEKITSFIKDEDFIFKLIVHSKLLQKKLNISIINYQEKYFSKRFDIEYYLDNYYSINELLSNDFYKDKLNKTILKNLIVLHLLKKINDKKLSDKEKEIFIEINNPFLEFLIRINAFDNFLNIKIDLNEIENNDIKNQYISAFQKMNKSNIKYTSLYFYFMDLNNVYNLNDFNIKFNQIKRLSFYEKYNNNKYDNIDKFFKYFISFDNISNNLVYLSLLFDSNKKIDKNLFEKINDIKTLNFLKLDNIELSDASLLKITNLEMLSLLSCKNIDLNDNKIINNNILLRLKFLDIFNSYISKPDSKFLLQCPELESLNLNFIDEKDKENYGKYNSILDFSSLKKLKKFAGNFDNLIFLKNNTSLEEIYFEDTFFEHSEENEIEILETFISIKSLKYFELRLKKINGSEIANIKGINTSVKYIKLILDYNYRCNYLYQLQEKFPNLEKIFIKAYRQIFGTDLRFKIKEKSKCKIKKIKLDLEHYYEIKFFSISYDKLESVKIEINQDNYGCHKLEKSFPIFNRDCKVIFKSLKVFNFKGFDFITKDIINNIYYNINNMPNLVNFKLECNSKDDIREDFYNNLIKKILSLKCIRKINISIRKKSYNDKGRLYTKRELHELNPKINFDLLYVINIYHLDK